MSAEHWSGARSREGEGKKDIFVVWFFGCLGLDCLVDWFGFLQSITADRNKIKASLGDSSNLYIWSSAWRRRLLGHRHDAAKVFAPLMVLKRGGGDRRAVVCRVVTLLTAVAINDDKSFEETLKGEGDI